MSLWYALGPAAIGTILGQTLIARAMRGLDAGQVIEHPGDAPNTTLGAIRWVMAGVSLTPIIFALAAAMLAWIDPNDFAMPLLGVGAVGGLVAIAQGYWVARRLPAIAEDPTVFGKALVVEAAMEIPALLALMNFFYAYLQVA